MIPTTSALALGVLDIDDEGMRMRRRMRRRKRRRSGRERWVASWERKLE